MSLATLGCAAFAMAPPKSQSAQKLDYLRDIRPIISTNCFPCHGQDEKKQQAALRLDRADSAYGKSDEGHIAIAPFKPQASALIARITASGPLKMPPEKSGHRLSAADIATLKRWIAEGAVYEPHWAFRPLRRPAVPIVENRKSKIENPIDSFILAGLKTSGLSPSPKADRFTLIRRASLDLTGLPPTPQEADAFLSDRSPNAYEKVVDRLLASSHFGEKWARMWLDLARYADSAGYGSDPLRPNLWPYRDWVINAFNTNLPYDQFVTNQLAGDLLPKPTSEQLIATAFHRNTMTNTEGGTDREEFRTAAVKDRSITTAQVFMGLTMGCAQCHSHKFDPITNREFYRFMAFFNQTEDNDQPDEKPTMPLLPEIQVKRQTELKDEIARLETGQYTPESKALLDTKKKELAAIKPVNLPIMMEVPPDKRRTSHVLTLGNFLLPGDAVEPGTPAAFCPMPARAPLNRLGVAEWIVSRDNPLTARVAVNRFWAQLFGTGIVETEEDFGQQGALPSNPQLLDWLACEFKSPVGNGRPWDMKRAIKLIVMSATYRQSSTATATAIEKDPRDRMLSHYPRRRLTAEGVRDQGLALSGLLNEQIGGPSVFPPQPDGLWQAAFNGDRTYPTSKGPDRYRRGIYTFWRRTVPPPDMAAFDAPSREICTMRRIHTNTPLQALVTLNDPVYLEMAQALARRIAREGGATPESRAAFGLRLTLGRLPLPAQIQPLVALYQRELARYTADAPAATKLATEPLGPLPAGAAAAELAAWTVVANVLLNMDAVLTVH
jgi:hypothetical protein